MRARRGEYMFAYAFETVLETAAPIAVNSSMPCAPRMETTYFITAVYARQRPGLWERLHWSQVLDQTSIDCCITQRQSTVLRV